ncbi:hypothetical protein GOV11_01165 [Candidatus Woesearchaeota archaeon]|nr:hypothetical protein [Candidatus Woesearchaeota archaeon]
MRWIVALVIVLMLSLPMVDALTYPTKDEFIIPLKNIYDPIERKNRPIVDYSWEELNDFMLIPKFHRWNNIDKVCESIYTMFDRKSPYCTAPQSEPTFEIPRGRSYSRAHASFEIRHPPGYVIRYPPPIMVRVDPIYPPWRPFYPRW